ncbi:hypothetical protein [Ornithinimicrobium pekingense]|uniref:HNH endonuclease n=1 Tax=Ornithinimicrobium pekingense TaxID=384677 RepID=A0ABQ2F3U7_9MICO|nr:hypothetical protein [Ornithinimicrobium pekingense]GGK56610.1 hypothetical protein GCM10011509_01210 [Ornithinimicrobium pekingense]
MDLSPGEALFESRLPTFRAQGPAPLHVVHHTDARFTLDLGLTDTPTGASKEVSRQAPTTQPGPPSWATPEGQQGAPVESPGPAPTDDAAHRSLSRLQEVGCARSTADAALIEAIIDVLTAARERLLHDKGLVGVELGRGQERSLEADVRRVAVAEVGAVLGFGITESQALVGLSSAAGDLRDVVLGALRRGEVTWPMVRVFWESSSRLDESQRMLVAMSLFGKDTGLACEERLGCDGDLLGRPWGDGSYRKACEREIRACEGTDVAGERERRRRAYARRRASVRVHDDGTATLSVTGPAVTLVAVQQRIDRIARRIRASGDERNLDKLRCDTIASLLLYGTIQLPGPVDAQQHPEGARDQDGQHDPDGQCAPCDEAREAEGPHDHGASQDHGESHDADVISPEGLEEIARVVNAQPLTQVQVVVPFAVLGNALPLCVSCAGTIDPGAPPGRPPRSTGSTPTRSSPPGPPDPRPADQDPRPLDQHPNLSDVPAPRDGPRRGLVGEVLGPGSHYITPGQARELALLPGTTLHRLVVDPLDGRLVERSIATYRPDADMRRQVVAADVYSRAPGPRTGSHACELDHVTPYGWAGGETSEVNLALLGKAPHLLKTLKAWRAVMGERRDLTFTTLLGHIVRTRTHDYRQYAHLRDTEDLEDRRDLANRAVYAALAGQPEHRCRRRGDAWLSLTHTDDEGGARPGPPPRAQTLDEVLGTTSEDDGRS